MTRYSQHVNARNTPQTEQASPKQVKNSAGGFSFKLDKWAKLDRWLILGAEGGSYYATERELTKSNATTIQECLKEDGLRTVSRIVEISEAGRAPKNDPAVFALALCAADANETTRRAALDALPRVCRIGTHLFQFAQSVEQFRGWGRGLRNAIAKWYGDKTADQVAWQLVKYQQRNGWSHRDLLRLSHADSQALSPQHAAAFRWAVTGTDGFAERDVKRRLSGKTERLSKYGAVKEENVPTVIRLFESLKSEKDEKKVCNTIREFKLTHEMVPNEFKNSADVWSALLEGMPPTAMIRNLAKMTNVGLLKPMSAATKLVVAKLGDKELLRKQRVHPIQLLSALKVYEQGHGERGSLSWQAVQTIVDALNDAFYESFDLITPSGKDVLLGLDVSGSMFGGVIAGVPGLFPAMAAAAMAMVTAHTDKSYHVMGFSGNFIPLNITPKMRLDQVMKVISGLPFNSTDCSLPMKWATQNKIPVDTFAVYTDNETYAGSPHPHQALQQHRNAFGRKSKLVVVGMIANDFTIADPDDAGMLDVVGFDTAAPALIADFSRD